MLKLTEDVQVFRFVGEVRGFSAPVILELDEDDARLAFRMAHDADPCNRWDAAQRQRVALALAADPAAVVPEAFVAAFRTLLNDGALDPAVRAQALALPGGALPARAHVARRPRRAAQRAGAHDACARRHARRRLAGGGRAPAAGGRVPLPPGRRRPPRAGESRPALPCRRRHGRRPGTGRALRRRHQHDRALGALAALVQSTSPARAAALQASTTAIATTAWLATSGSPASGAWRWGDAAEPALARVRVLLSDPRLQPCKWFYSVFYNILNLQLYFLKPK